MMLDGVIRDKLHTLCLGTLPAVEKTRQNDTPVK